MAERIDRSVFKNVFNQLMEHFGLKDKNDVMEFFNIIDTNAGRYMEGRIEPLIIYKNKKVAKEINAEWLITGRGEMLKKDKVVSKPVVEEPASMVEYLKKENKRLEESLQKSEERCDKLLNKLLGQ